MGKLYNLVTYDRKFEKDDFLKSIKSIRGIEVTPSWKGFLSNEDRNMFSLYDNSHLKGKTFAFTDISDEMFSEIHIGTPGTKNSNIRDKIIFVKIPKGITKQDISYFRKRHEVKTSEDTSPTWAGMTTCFSLSDSANIGDIGTVTLQGSQYSAGDVYVVFVHGFDDCPTHPELVMKFNQKTDKWDKATFYWTKHHKKIMDVSYLADKNKIFKDGHTVMPFDLVDCNHLFSTEQINRTDAIFWNTSMTGHIVYHNYEGRLTYMTSMKNYVICPHNRQYEIAFMPHFGQIKFSIHLDAKKGQETSVTKSIKVSDTHFTSNIHFYEDNTDNPLRFEAMINKNLPTEGKTLWSKATSFKICALVNPYGKVENRMFLDSLTLKNGEKYTLKTGREEKLSKDQMKTLMLDMNQRKDNGWPATTRLYIKAFANDKRTMSLNVKIN